MPLNWDHPRWQGNEGAQLFERLCASLLGATGFREVRWRQGHPDEGWDIEAECDVAYPGGSRRESWYVQCKRYSTNRGVPPTKIDTKRIDMFPKKPDCLLLVTNSFFLPKVHDWANVSHPYRVELWERDTIESLVLRQASIVVEYFPEVALSLKDDFLSSLVHMLRSSLQWLYDGIHYAQHLCQGQSSEVDDAFGRLRTTAQHTTMQVERFGLVSRLDYSPTSSGRHGVVDVNRLLEKTVELFSPLSSRVNVRVSLENQCQVRIPGDERQLSVLFYDLVDNALKYSFSGTAVRLTARTREEQECVEVEVMNRGLGIPPDEIAHVFEKYYRVRNREEGRFIPGLGIGLALCQRIVKDHNGSIRIVSQEDTALRTGGAAPWVTTCLVCLPLAEDT